MTKEFLQNFLYLSLLILFPSLYLFLNHDFLYTHIGYIDPFIYKGHFLHQFESRSAEFLADYKSSRLPWIFFGELCFSVFRPNVAHFLIVILPLFGSSTAMYYISKIRLSKEGALLVALAFSLFPFNYMVGGWEYHSNGAAFYFLWGVYFLISPSINSKHVSIFISGIFLANVGFINATYLNFFPALILSPLLLKNVSRINHILDLGWGFLGAGFSFLFWACLNKFVLGREFLFLANDIKYILEASKGTHGWLSMHTDWLNHPGHIALPICIFILILPALFFYIKNNKDYKMQFYIGLIHLTGVIFFLIWHLLGQPIMAWDYLSHPLTISGWLSFSFLMPVSSKNRVYLGIKILLFSLIALSPVVIKFSRQFGFLGDPPFHYSTIFIIIICVITLMFWKRKMALAVTLFLTTFPGTLEYSLSSIEKYCVSNKELFLFMNQTFEKSKHLRQNELEERAYFYIQNVPFPEKMIVKDGTCQNSSSSFYESLLSVLIDYPRSHGVEAKFVGNQIVDLDYRDYNIKILKQVRFLGFSLENIQLLKEKFKSILNKNLTLEEKLVIKGEKGILHIHYFGVNE